MKMTEKPMSCEVSMPGHHTGPHCCANAGGEEAHRQVSGKQCRLFHHLGFAPPDPAHQRHVRLEVRAPELQSDLGDLLLQLLSHRPCLHGPMCWF